MSTPKCAVDCPLTMPSCCAAAIADISPLATQYRPGPECPFVLIAQWEEKAKNWMASPEAGKQLDGYRELAGKLAEKDEQLDQLRTELATANTFIETMTDERDGLYADLKSHLLYIVSLEGRDDLSWHTIATMAIERASAALSPEDTETQTETPDVCVWTEIEGGYTTKYRTDCGRLEVYGGKYEDAVCECDRKVKIIPLKED